MRLIIFRMNDWRHAVYTAITPDNPEYIKQSSRFKGCRGNCQNPVCAIVVYPEGKALEFYSCKDNKARISEALYLPYPEINRNDDTIKICERCYKAVIYQTAAMAFATLGDSDSCIIFDKLSKSILI